MARPLGAESGSERGGRYVVQVTMGSNQWIN